MKIEKIPQPKPLELVCVEYPQMMIIGAYNGIKDGNILLNNAITLSRTINGPNQNQRGVYGKRVGQINFRWNGQNYSISNQNNNMTVSAGTEKRNLHNYNNIHTGVDAIYKVLITQGHRELADTAIKNYKPK